MEVGDLLTSAGINIAICVVLLTLYSILRKQPGNACVYFTRKLVSEPINGNGDLNCLTRFVPSASWIARAWQATDEEILAVAGVDAVVFMRIVVFSIRVFIIAAIICLFLLPVNYNEQDKWCYHHTEFGAESLDVFTVANIKVGSKWFWAHCAALYLISCSACALLYFEYKSITKMRLAHITGSPPNPSHFTVLVRGVPGSPVNSYSESVEKFFSTYYPESYLSHQIVYGDCTIDKLVKDAEKIYRMLKTINPRSLESSLPSCLPGGTTHSFMVLNQKADRVLNSTSIDRQHSSQNKKECPAAFVFFKTRYAALVAAQVLQSSNPMLWVTELAPEPHDVYWSNLSIPYKQVWFRKIITLIASVVFMLVFLVPVTFVQGLTQGFTLDQLSCGLPILKEILKKQKFLHRVVTGYLPSVILMLFLYTVPPTMMLFSAMEGTVSRSQRKRSACIKVLYFMIWNVFFVNVLSGPIITQLSVVSRFTDIPIQLAQAVPAQATFFTTYVLSSGWASLSCEIMQPFPLFYNFFIKFILRKDLDPSDCALTFPHHTEIPRLLLFVFLGFTFSIMAPSILPFLLVFFCLAFLVYRNQFLNVYVPKYDSGGEFWPIVHNGTIFSLLLAQVIALGVFGLKRSPVASGFVIPLIVLTLLFNEYCRQRFSPVFKRRPAQILIEMDQQDEQLGRKQEIQNQIRSAYFQNPEFNSVIALGTEDGLAPSEVTHSYLTIEAQKMHHHQFYSCLLGLTVLTSTLI